MSADIPLIWTSKGNLPADNLRYVTLWQVGDYTIQFVEEYYLGDELVRRNLHIHYRTPSNG